MTVEEIRQEGRKSIRKRNEGVIRKGDSRVTEEESFKKKYHTGGRYERTRGVR